MSEKVRILYVTDVLRRRFGVTSVIMNYVTHLNLDELQIDILAYENSEIDVVQELKARGASVLYMPTLGLKNIPMFIGYMRTFFAEHTYDIVHSHFNQLDNIIFSIARKNGVNACISHSHSLKLSENPIKALRNRAMFLGAEKKADYWAACSEMAGVALFGDSFTTSLKKVIINNGIHCDRYNYNDAHREKIRKELGILENEIVLGHVGSFKPVKNQAFLIDVLFQLKKRDSKYCLVLVGDGETKSEAEKKVRELGLEQSVKFVGARANIQEYLSAIDVFVMPSFHEGLGIAAVEAQANGLECVISDSVPQEVDLTGVHFVSLKKDSYEWAETIDSLQHIHHPEYNDIVKKAGYDTESVCEDLMHFYCRIAKNEVEK